MIQYRFISFSLLSVEFLNISSSLIYCFTSIFIPSNKIFFFHFVFLDDYLNKSLTTLLSVAICIKFVLCPKMVKILVQIKSHFINEVLWCCDKTPKQKNTERKIAVYIRPNVSNHSYQSHDLHALCSNRFYLLRFDKF